MAYNDKEAGSGFDVTANEMLRRLNNQYKADKFADKYTDNAEYLKAEDGSVQIDISTLSDDEFKTLFDSYLATSNMNVSDMTDSTYKSLQYHIINLQKKSGATLLTGDEMERHFEDAGAPAFIPENEEEFGKTTEFMMHDSQTFEKLKEEAKPQPQPRPEPVPAAKEMSKEEQIKQRRMSIFSKLNALMHAAETEEISVGLETGEYPVERRREQIPEEPATEEFIIPSYIAEEAENAIGPVEEETTPEEEMLENYMENTGDLEAYEPKIEIPEVPTEEPEEFEEAEEIEATEEEQEFFEGEPEPEEIPEIEEFEEEEEVPDEIVPEEPEAYISEEDTPEEDVSEEYTPEEYQPEAYTPEEGDFESEEGEPFEEYEEEELEENAEIIDALVEDPIEDYEDVPGHIFDEPSYETEENDYPEMPYEEEEEEDEEVSRDYVSFEQNSEILSEYKKKYTSVRVRMGIGVALAVILLVLENIGMFGIQLPYFLRNPAVLVPLEWTIIFADALLVCDALFAAAKKLIKFQFEPATVTLIAFLFATCTTFSSLFIGKEVRLFNFSFAICVLFNLISVFLSVRKEIFTFKVISSPKKKHAVVRMPQREAAAHAQEFMDYISEDSEFYRVDEADFVDEYFAQKKKTPVMYKRLRVLIPVIFAASCLISVLNATVQNANLYESLAFGYLAFVMCAPIAVFFVNELPLYLSAVKAYSNNSGILGDSAPEIMENMAVVSFADSDVFKTDGVRIKGVKVIDDNRIDHIIHYASSVFNIVGGPLAKVFKQASLESAQPESAEIRVISSRGIDAAIDGKHIVVGTEQFMEAQCFRPVREAGDENWEGKTNRRLLYLACDEEIIAKFYVEYSVNPEFVYLVKKLSESGICVSVRTNDPCVDVDLFYKNNLNPEQYPLRVVKGETEVETKYNVSAKKSGIVAAGSIKGLIKTVLLCDRLANVMKTNLVVKVVSALAGLLVMATFVFIHITLGGVWSLYFGIYQLSWLVPVYIISKIYI